MAELLGCDEALERLLALAPPPDSVHLDIAACDGLYLAEDTRARLTLPPGDVSAMDGYALRHAELPGPLRIVREAAAGRPLSRPLARGEAARIFTGALVPEGADSVAIQEDATVENGGVRFAAGRPAAAGANIRRRGFDIEAGAALLARGTPLTPAGIGLLAAAGHGRLAVHPRPRLALIATGDELVPAGTTPGPGQIVNANAPMLAALLRRAGAEVAEPATAGDSAAALGAAIDAARGADLIVTIGGASVGDHDLVRPALLAAGATIDFWRVAIRPGKPLLAGRLGKAPVVGLPGNPASAFITARVFLVPLLRQLAGSSAPLDRPEQAPLGVDLPANGPRRHYLRARLDAGRVVPFPTQDSSLFRTLAGAEALLVRAASAPPASAGDQAAFLRL